MRARQLRPRIPFAVVAGGLVLALAAVLAVRAGLDSTPASIPRTSDRVPISGPTTHAAPQPPPACSFADRLTPHRGHDDWKRTLLDTVYRVGPAYEPPDLVLVQSAGFDGDYRVRDLLIGDLRALGEAAERAGAPVAIIAAYRSWDEQASLFERRVDLLGLAEARRRVARPGHSEHQLGTAVDFRTPGAPDVTVAWAGTREGRWMEANAHRFGFVESYPRNQQDTTCYTYEPWHYRYVGRETAADVRASGLTLREFLWRWAQTGSPPA